MNSQSILSNIIVACLIGGLAMAVGRQGRRAALAHILWIMFFIKLVTPPVLHWNVTIPFALGIDWEWSWGNTIWNWLLLIWLAGFLLLLIRGFVASGRFALLLRREGSVDPDATEFVRSLLGKHRYVPHVVRLPVRLSPMLFGSLLSPKIVCPDELWGLLTKEQRHAFLAHEAAHYFRRDHWVRWLEWIVTAVYWWFPGVYFGRGQLERHEEACCDAWAVQRLGTTPRAYAETLLSVVDFVSEHDANLPRLANGMQPTYTLEERLRLLMRPQSNSYPSNSIAYSAIVLCTGLWLLHPTLGFHSKITANSSSFSVVGPLDSQSISVSEPSVPPKPYQWPSEHSLPTIPPGFWNASAESKWADFQLKLGNARIKAEVGKGISVVPEKGPQLNFTSDELVALAEIPSTGRLVIGDVQGRLRLWDLEAGTPVSLIGQHKAPITSLTYHPRFGLVSADRTGQLIRWDIDSGLMLATNDFHSPIQSVRSSERGDQLCVMTGSWHDCGHCQVSVLDTKTLVPDIQHEQFPSAATIAELPIASSQLFFFPGQKQWVSIDWQGELRAFKDPSIVLGQIQKDLVSSLVFAQQPLTMEQIAPPPPVQERNATEFIYVEP